MLGVLMSTGQDLSRRPGAEIRSLGAETAALRPLVRGVIAKVLNLSPSDPDVEDCAHEALRRALEGQDRLRAGEPLRPWVVGIAKHVALDAARSRKRSRERHVEPRPDHDGEGSSSPVDELADAAPGPLDALERARNAKMVRDALEKLPAGAREALSLFHLEGLGYQEISARLDVPLGTVATWVSRGRKAMVAALAKETVQA